MESGGDFWKDRHDEPGEWIIGSSRDFKSGGHYPLSAKKVNSNSALLPLLRSLVGHRPTHSAAPAEEIVFRIRRMISSCSTFDSIHHLLSPNLSDDICSSISIQGFAGICL